MPSRLARARGVLNKLSGHVDGITDPAVEQEMKRFLKITRDASIQLEKLVKGQAPTASTMKRLAKAHLFPTLQSRVVTGKDVGDVRKALRLTIKNVWDYPEMRRRKLAPTAEQKDRVCTELRDIKSAVKRILA